MVSLFVFLSSADALFICISGKDHQCLCLGKKLLEVIEVLSGKPLYYESHDIANVLVKSGEIVCSIRDKVGQSNVALSVLLTTTHP